MRSHSLLFVLPLLAAASPLSSQSAIEGTWLTEAVRPGVIELESYWLEFEAADSGFILSIRTSEGELELPGTFDAATGVGTFEDDTSQGNLKVDLRLEGERLVGALRGERRYIEVDAGRATRKSKPELLLVDFDRERPETITLDGLPGELGQTVSIKLLEFMDAQGVVGLSAAVVYEGELIDVRSFGWEDYHEDIPASEETMYRWASIGKPLTAVAALQLAETEELDLDRDVREYVPEWPHNQALTSRQLLCHQSGVVHYENMKPRTLTEYDVEHPWADSILRLDMFKETDLLFEPGQRFSYSTPGYVLLGAVIERASKGSFVEQVMERVCKPLEMTSMQPDYQWVEIPHRATGYHLWEGRSARSVDDNIAWKLPAGGWISTVTDLARFGLGLMESDILTNETRQAMWEAQKLPDGSATRYGLGVGVGNVSGTLTIAHSGGQNKTSTYLVCAPEAGAAVALMCNTQGISLSSISTSILTAMLELE